jgi:hypothetical protein
LILISTPGVSEAAGERWPDVAEQRKPRLGAVACCLCRAYTIRPGETNMAQLTAKEFKIQNYRNIDDSGWIPLETITALVGRNESGKTALMKALHKFNSATPQPYVPQREFPRDRFTRDFRNAADWPVSSVKFNIEDDLRRTLAAITAPNEAPNIVVPTKFYDGSFKYVFEPELKETEIPPDAVLAAIDSFSNAAMRLAAPAPEQEDTYSTIRKDLLRDDSPDKSLPQPPPREP